MPTVAQVPETYDTMYASGGYAGTYHLHYRRSQYYPMFKCVLRRLRRSGCSSVLEVGCGNGAFAHLLEDRWSSLPYRGFDFSEEAIRLARQSSRHPDRFVVGDATCDEAYAGANFDVIICTEVLEHLPDDHGVISRWPRGVKCICSVPSFDSKYHVRFFESADAVRERYSGLIDILGVDEVPVPMLAQLSLGSYAAAAWKNRFKPRKLAQLVGLLPTAGNRRWFVFRGVRR